MASWYLAPALAALRSELNRLHPLRSKVSDGTIGDAAHAASTSDHNPKPDGYGGLVVDAIDITHDPVHGLDCHALARHLTGDPRVKYLIWADRIWNPSVSPLWRAYSGANDHTRHLHCSIKTACRRDTTPWWTPLPPASIPPPPLSVVAAQYPDGENMLTRHDVHMPALDDQGKGWFRLGVPAANVVSFVPNGPHPPVDGYWEMPIFARQARDGATIVSVTEGKPGAPLLVAVWVVG